LHAYSNREYNYQPKDIFMSMSLSHIYLLQRLMLVQIDYIVNQNYIYTHC